MIYDDGGKKSPEETVVAIVLSIEETAVLSRRSKVTGDKGGGNDGCYLMKEEAKRKICV